MNKHRREIYEDIIDKVETNMQDMMDATFVHFDKFKQKEDVLIDELRSLMRFLENNLKELEEYVDQTTEIIERD